MTDEDTGPAQPPPPSKLPAPAFRLKNDSDLFGLGLEEMGPKESSDEGRRVWVIPLLGTSCNLEVPVCGTPVLEFRLPMASLFAIVISCEVGETVTPAGKRAPKCDPE